MLVSSNTIQLKQVTFTYICVTIIVHIIIGYCEMSVDYDLTDIYLTLYTFIYRSLVKIFDHTVSVWYTNNN